MPTRPLPARSRLGALHDSALTVLAVALVAVAHLWRGRGGLAVDVVAAAFLVPLVLVDVRERRLPDGLTLGGTTMLLALLGLQGLFTGEPAPLAGAVLGALLMAGVLLVLHLISPSGMGFGDVKLGVLLGVVIGCRAPSLVLPALLVAGVLGGAVGLVLMVGRRQRRVTLPFGPCLVAGTVVALAVGAS